MFFFEAAQGLIQLENPVPPENVDDMLEKLEVYIAASLQVATADIVLTYDAETNAVTYTIYADNVTVADGYGNALETTYQDRIAIGTNPYGLIGITYAGALAEISVTLETTGLDPRTVIYISLDFLSMYSDFCTCF